MALQKSIVSVRTGATLTYHDVFSVQFTDTKIIVLISSYVDAASKVAGKFFVDVTQQSFSYDGSPIGKSVKAYAQDLIKALPAFSGAIEVA